MPDPAPNRFFRQTGPGASALAVVRLEGPAVRRFLAERFSRTVEPHRPAYGELSDDSGVIDDPVVVCDATGVDVVLHGSTWVIESVCALAAGYGFEDVDAVPQSIAEEVAAALPLVKTELAARTLIAQESAWADLPRGEASLRAILADDSLQHLLHSPTVAIVGLPNAGKSTLANVLFGTSRAIVSPIAGTTRDWVGEPANLDGLVVTLVDTPGVHHTSDQLESRAIDVSAKQIARADLVIVLLDGSIDDPRQTELPAGFVGRRLLVLNKSDVRHPSWTDEQLRREGAIPISARAETGVDVLVRHIHLAFHVGQRSTGAARIWTERQRAAVTAMLAAASVRQPI